MTRPTSKADWLRYVGIGFWIPGAILLPLDLTAGNRVRPEFAFCLFVATACLLAGTAIARRLSFLWESIASVVFIASLSTAVITLVVVLQVGWQALSAIHVVAIEVIAVTMALASWYYLRSLQRAAQPIAPPVA